MGVLAKNQLNVFYYWALYYYYMQLKTFCFDNPYLLHILENKDVNCYVVTLRHYNDDGFTVYLRSFAVHLTVNDQ